MKRCLIILDRSGSMARIRDDMLGALRHFITELTPPPAPLRLTLVQFDTMSVDTVIDDKHVFAVNPDELQLDPRGGTPLLDALGTTLAAFEPKVDEPPMVAIITDGEENSSKEYTLADVKTVIDRLTSQGWLFHFFGANVDAYAEMQKYGYSSSTPYTPDRKGTIVVSTTLVDRTRDYTGGGSS